MKMKQVYVADREQWRRWLSEHHASEAGIWLIFYKKKTSKPTVVYDDAVEEALCFGWIDSIIKKIDDEKYARKFTPRKDKSVWSQLNKRRVDKMIKQGRMTEAGRAKIKAAQKNGSWNQRARSREFIEVPTELIKALAQNKKAKEHFDQLAPTYRRHYIGWIATAKRPDTRERRIAEAVALLEKGQKLGMK
ncbi:MAG: YdeI/OmpD-associated family protein [Sedimentisphaerales bacterium]|nr:YdeI/OmpD-associated family protein [Sedimentisphaerales bacterium]